MNKTTKAGNTSVYRPPDISAHEAHTHTHTHTHAQLISPKILQELVDPRQRLSCRVVDRAFSFVCEFASLSVPAVKEKRLELLTPQLLVYGKLCVGLYVDTIA